MIPRDGLRRGLLALEILVHRVHPLLLAGVLAWSAGMVLTRAVLPLWQHQLHVLQDEGSPQGGAALAPAPDASEVARTASADNLTRFRSNLGDARYVEQQLRSLFVIARDLGLALPQGQYRLVCEDNGEFCGYRVQLPVHGSYVKVRAFIEQTLQVIPFASVNEVSFKREAVSDDELDARIGLTFYTRLPADGRPAGEGGS